MSFKHLLADKTLKGRSGWRFRKCRFSVTRASAPTHSVKPAIKASEGLRPFISYFTPISKGTKKSSSMVVKMLMNLMKFWNSFGDKFVLTSSTIVRHIEIECEGKLSIRNFKRDSHLSFLKNPNANIYSLASSTSRKLFLPELLSGLTQMFDHFFFTHTNERGRSLGYTFTQFLEQFFSFSFFIFHDSTYEIKGVK